MLKEDFDENFEKMFQVALGDIEMKSSPGFSVMSHFGTTNGDILKWDGQTVDLERAEMLMRVTYYRMTKLVTHPESDPIKVFIKQEPHKISKLEDGRLRLISSVSLTDAMIDRILFMPLANKIKNTYHNTNLMVGWSPVKGGYRQVAQAFIGKRALCIDKSAWDWTVCRWLLDGVKKLILNLAVNPPLWWVQMVEVRFNLLFSKPTFKFSDGVEIQQPFDGIMKSGCYLTIILNSLSQFLLHALACERTKIDPFETFFFAMGDDTVQELLPEDKQSAYMKVLYDFGLGLKIKIADVPEFAGFHLSADKYVPAYRDKHLFLLAHLTADKEVAVQTLKSYQLLYYFDAEILYIIDNIIEERGLYEAKMSRLALNALANG